MMTASCWRVLLSRQARSARSTAIRTSKCSVIESGVFDVTIDGKTKRLSAGESYLVAPNLVHGAVAVEAGVIVDSFSPLREDFL